MIHFIKDRSFKNQLNKIFLMRLMVAGLLVFMMAVGIHFLSLSAFKEQMHIETQNELVQLLSQTESLQKSFNDHLEREGAQEADRIFERFAVSKSPFKTSVLYRVIDLKNQVIQSNHETDLPRPFLPNESLYHTAFGTVDEFNSGHLELLQVSIAQGKSKIFPVKLLDPNDHGGFVIYRPYENRVVIEIFMFDQAGKDRILDFFREQLSEIFRARHLESLIITYGDEQIYAKGHAVSLLAKGSRKSGDLGTFEASIDGQPLVVNYAFANSASDIIKPAYVYWLLAVYCLVSMALFFLLKRESKRFLDPMGVFLNLINNIKMGHYEKRLNVPEYVGLAPLNIGLNDKLDQIEQLLEEKKVQEDRLRQLQMTRLHLETTEQMTLEATQSEENRLKKAVLQSEVLYMQLILTLSSAIEAKDLYTSGHCERVMTISVKLAECLGLSGQDIEDVRLAALLHDVGKLGLPEEILNKTGPLSDYEWSVLKRHTRFGEEILADFNVSDVTKTMVAMHHEHYDGKGYPKGEMKTDIPLGARILCLVDAYDAMSHPRPYRLTPMGTKDIVEELHNQSGRQFDPILVELLIQLIADQGGSSDEA